MARRKGTVGFPRRVADGSKFSDRSIQDNGFTCVLLESDFIGGGARNSNLKSCLTAIGTTAYPHPISWQDTPTSATSGIAQAPGAANSACICTAAGGRNIPLIRANRGSGRRHDLLLSSFV